MASLDSRREEAQLEAAETLRTSGAVWSAEGDISVFKQELNPTFDPCGPETDENLSPNSQFFREGTPEADEGINLPPGSWNKPYSPRSNPFGERPSQRTPGARSFIRRLSTHSSISGGAVTNVMADVGREENVWLSTPEVSLQEVKSSWDAVGRIEKLLDDQRSAGTPVTTEPAAEPAAEDGASWRQRVANTAFHGTPSPTSSRASSMSGGEAFGPAGAQRRRSAAGASPLAQGTPQQGTPDESAEIFPRSFRIQRSGSADSLASLLSHTSDITAREGSSFEKERDALRERKMETILEPGETPLRAAEGNAAERRGLFARSADGALPTQATPRSARRTADEAGSPSSARSKKWLDGLGTPRSAAKRSPPAQGTGGGFASPIEVQETAEYSLPAPDMHAAAAREVTTPFVRLQEPVPLTPVINEAHEQHTKADKRKAVATPYAKLREPVPLTPVIKSAHRRHAQVSAVAADSQSNGLLSVLQLLLVVLTLAGVLLLPSLSALIPNFNGHILPSAPYKASRQTSQAAMYPGFADRSWSNKSWKDVPSLFWEPTNKHAQPAANSLSSTLSGLFRQDAAGAKFGLLGRPSQQPPTPHLDRLLGTMSTSWAHVAAQLPASVIDRLPHSMQPPRAKASSTVQKATGAALKAAEQGKAQMEKVMRSVQSTLLPTAEPATDASNPGTLKPKIQAAPAPAPPNLAQKSAAAQQKVVTQSKKLAKQASEATKAAGEKLAAVESSAAAAAQHAKSAAQDGARAAASKASERVQRSKAGAVEMLGAVSEKLSDMAQQARVTAAEQAWQAAAPIQAAAHRASSVTARSAVRSAAAVREVMSKAKQGAKDHPQGILAGAVVAVLACILAGLLALIGRSSQAVKAEPEEAVVLGSPVVTPLATPVPLFTPRATPKPARRSRLAVTEMPTSPRPATSTARTARAARTAPVSSGKSCADLMATADTPATRTRSRSRLAA